MKNVIKNLSVFYAGANISVMGENKEKLSKTVMFDAWEEGLDPEDPEVIALAKKAQERKERKLTYRIGKHLSDNAPAWVGGAITAVGGAVLTQLLKG